VLSLGYDGGRQ